MIINILDSLLSQFRDGEVHAAIRRIGFELRELKSQASPQQWHRFIALASSHPIGEVLRQDPFTNHSYTRPRGYPGDADLLDFIYGYRSPDDRTTDIGNEIFSYTARTAPAPLSVQERLRLVAERIDLAAAQHMAPNILSVACGHLREAELSDAFTCGKLGSLSGIDADPASIESVRKRLGVRADLKLQQANITQLLAGKFTDRCYQLIYSLGLYDYLDDRLATRLTAGLFDHLDHGGALLIANFMPQLHDAGYMESFMNWSLIFRTSEQLPILLSRIAPSQIESTTTSMDTLGNIAYLEVRRR